MTRISQPSGDKGPAGLQGRGQEGLPCSSKLTFLCRETGNADGNAQILQCHPLLSSLTSAFQAVGSLEALEDQKAACTPGLNPKAHKVGLARPVDTASLQEPSYENHRYLYYHRNDLSFRTVIVLLMYLRMSTMYCSIKTASEFQ